MTESVELRDPFVAMLDELRDGIDDDVDRSAVVEELVLNAYNTNSVDSDAVTEE